MVLVFGSGLVAGFVNVLAGGGSLLTLPILIFLGLPPALANGTNRVGVLAQNIAAVWDFRRQGVSDLRTGLRLSLATLPGAVLGAFVSIRVPDAWFKAILAAVLVLSVVAILIPPKRRTDGPSELGRVSWVTYAAFFGIGWYGGFLQAGVGFLLMAILYQLMHIDLVRVNMYKVLVVAIFTVPALLVFVWTRNVDWTAGLILGAGNATGALVGTRMSVRGGERPIRIVLALALVAMAAKLALG